MPTITGSMFVLAVNDLSSSAAYYAEILGFTVHEIGDDGWRIFARDNCRIMAGHCPDAMSPKELGDHSGELPGAMPLASGVSNTQALSAQVEGAVGSSRMDVDVDVVHSKQWLTGFGPESEDHVLELVEWAM